MVFVTGDLHGHIDISKFSTRNIPYSDMISKNDYMIICGDFGLVWDNSPRELYWRKWLSEKPWVTLFVQGNHENYPMFDDFETIEYLGGKVKKIADDVYCLLRGEIYTICGKTFFCMGGASSHDKEYRIEGRSWWREELPSDIEYETAMSNLEKYNYSVDFIITHCICDSVMKEINYGYEHDKLTNFLEHFVKERVNFRFWYFGHYHINKTFKEKYVCLYNDIIQIL